MHRMLILFLLGLGCGCSSSSNDGKALSRNFGLDPQVIANENPEKLAEKAREQILDALKGHKGDWNPVLASMPQEWRAAYTTWWLEAEVGNGGLHQYFWNTDGKLNDATLADLKFIGADAQVDLFARALVNYSKHDYPKEKQAAGKDWEKFTKGYNEKRFDALDTEFFKIKPGIDTKIGQHIKRHPELYSSKK